MNNYAPQIYPNFVLKYTTPVTEFVCGQRSVSFLAEVRRNDLSCQENTLTDTILCSILRWCTHYWSLLQRRDLKTKSRQEKHGNVHGVAGGTNIRQKTPRNYGKENVNHAHKSLKEKTRPSAISFRIYDGSKWPAEYMGSHQERQTHLSILSRLDCLTPQNRVHVVANFPNCGFICSAVTTFPKPEFFVTPYIYATGREQKWYGNKRA